MLIQLIVLVASLVAVALPVVGIVRGFGRVLRPQLLVFPVAHVYAGGLALMATVAGFLVTDLFGRGSPRLPMTLVALWCAWAALSVVSFAGVGVPGPRAMLQTAQFAAYGVTAIGLAVVLRQRPALRTRIVLTAAASSVLLAITMMLMFRNGITEAGIPFVTIGANEHSIVLVYLAIIPACWMFVHGRGLWRVAAIATAVLALAAMQVAQARGPSAIAAAMLAGTLVYRFVGNRAWLATIMVLIGVFLTARLLDVAGVLALVFSTDNFSNLERLGLLQASYRLFMERPLFGWGWGNLDAVIPGAFETVGSYPHAHNTYAHFAVELGIGGLILQSVLYGHLLWRALRQKARGRHDEFLMAALLFVALLATSLVEDLVYGGSRALVVMVLLGLVHGRGVGGPDESAAAPRPGRAAEPSPAEV